MARLLFGYFLVQYIMYLLNTALMTALDNNNIFIKNCLHKMGIVSWGKKTSPICSPTSVCVRRNFCVVGKSDHVAVA